MPCSRGSGEACGRCHRWHHRSDRRTCGESDRWSCRGCPSAHGWCRTHESRRFSCTVRRPSRRGRTQDDEGWPVRFPPHPGTEDPAGLTWACRVVRLRMPPHDVAESFWKTGAMNWKSSVLRSKKTDCYATSWGKEDGMKQTTEDCCTDPFPLEAHWHKETLRYWSRTHHHCQSWPRLAAAS